MIRILRFLLLALCIVSFAGRLNAQVSAFNVGWSVSHFFKPLSNLESDMYKFNRYNLNNTNMVKLYSMPDYSQGLYVDYRVGGPGGGMILGWSNKHAIAEAEGIAKDDSLYYIRNIKTRLNVFSWGFYFSIYRRLKMGMTYDFGKFTIVQKIATKDEFKSADWVPHYDNKGGGTMGATINISYPIPLGKSIQLRFQPYAQWVWLYKPFQYANTTYTNNYFFSPSNYGINVFLSFIWGNH
jgi:hypothetical protein